MWKQNEASVNGVFGWDNSWFVQSPGFTIHLEWQILKKGEIEHLAEKSVKDDGGGKMMMMMMSKSKSKSKSKKILFIVGTL